MNTVTALLAAIVVGMLGQAVMTFKQTGAFSAAVRDLRKHGSVAVGGAGKRYRGGKAFVAIASDNGRDVTKAVSLTGWTTFARPKEIPHAQGLRLSQLRGDAPLPALDPRARDALRNAAQSLHAHLVKATVPGE